MTRVAGPFRSPRPLRAGPLPAASVAETLDILARVVTPNVAKGVIIRRPRMVGLAGALDLDRRAVEALQRLRNRHGSGPLMLRMPGPDRAVILDPDHVRRVLQETPEPFFPASTEKRAALSHFEPKVALISEGDERTDRRRFNERVLDSESPRPPDRRRISCGRGGGGGRAASPYAWRGSGLGRLLGDSVPRGPSGGLRRRGRG
jgi:hypothetical protein